MSYSPLVIIGAPRSGTNMLRDVITEIPEVATWPCDEINYIWRHKNVRYPSDELPARLASTQVKRYIRRQFDWVSRRYAADVVVEKTCANSLRVPFVDRVMPEAQYVFIRRHGLDAVGSAMARWKAPLDIPYLARKARFVPTGDMPWYAARYLRSRLYRLISREGRVALWGPRLDHMDDLLAQHSLEEACAIQWRRCVEKSLDAFATISDARWLEIVYEDFVRNPEAELRRVLDFTGIEADAAQLRTAVTNVRDDSVGKGRACLEQETVEQLWPQIQEIMARLGYAE